MRTTLVLDDRVVQAARHRAVDAGITLSEFVNRALVGTMALDSAAPERPFVFPEYGGGRTVDHAPDALWQVGEEEDRQSMSED